VDTSVVESRTVIVDYEMFNQYSKTIIKFAIKKEDASTCKEEGSRYFYDFWSTIKEEGYNKYLNENDAQPVRIYIRINDIYPISEFRHRDVVYY